MHLARAGLILVALLVVLPACRRSVSPPDGAWRDQFVFVSDDGTVLSLGVHRQANGNAEAKVWFGSGGSWSSVFYKQFSITRDQAPSLARTLNRLSKSPGRVQVMRESHTLGIELRTPDRSVGISAKQMRHLGESTDPEGTTTYRAGRAWGQDNSMQHNGWLIAEETPAAKPHQPFVDYGDFVFLVAASNNSGVLVAKRSLRRPEFNHAFTLQASHSKRTQDVVINVGATAVEVKLKQLGVVARYRIGDRNTSRGVGPGGQKLVYETLFLRGVNAGVAFLIRPEKESSR